MNKDSITRETSAQSAAEILNKEASALCSGRLATPKATIEALWEILPDDSAFERYANGYLLELPTGQRLRLVTRRNGGSTNICHGGLGYDAELAALSELGDRIRNYLMTSYECGSHDRVTAKDNDEAVEKLKDWLRDGNWGEDPCYVYGSVVEVNDDNEEIGEKVEGEVGVNIWPPPKPCIGPDSEEYEEHDWREPYKVVGGLRENPGVFSEGGRITIRSVCSHCGMQKYYTSKTPPGNYPPEPGHHRYEAADDETIAWVKSLA